MLLVIIALGAATALTSVYLSSRRNSGLIGRNAATAASAHWAANAAAELAVAAMQTGDDWRPLVSDGVLFDNIALSGAAVAALVTDLRGDPPDEHDADLVVTGVAAIDGVTATSQRIVSTIPAASLEEALNPYLDEYAVYVTDQMDLGSDGVIAVWPDSPAARLNPPVKLGSSNTAGDAFVIDPTAHLIQGVGYLPRDATSALRNLTGAEPFVGDWIVPVDVPVVPPSVSRFSDLVDRTKSNNTGGSGGGGRGGSLSLIGGATSSGGGNHQQFTGSGTNVTLATGWYRKVTIDSGAVVTLNGGFEPAVYSIDDLELANNAVLRIVGEVHLQVRKDLRIRNGAAIELANDGSRLTIVAHGAVEIDNAGVGTPREVARNAARTLEDVPPDASPEAIRITTTLAAPDPLSPSAGGGNLSIRIDGGSIVVAAIHAPETLVQIDEASILIGRVTAQELQIDGASALLYDPALDNRAGYTSPDGPLYTVDGDPIDGLFNALLTLPSDTTTDSLDDYVSAFIDELIYNTLNLTETLISSLLSGGSTSGDPDPRVGSLAEPIIWPVDAYALERDSVSLTDAFAGTFVLVDQGIANDTLIANELIMRSTGGTPTIPDGGLTMPGEPIIVNLN
jgi:uncharacterized membrane protein YgcG